MAWASSGSCEVTQFGDAGQGGSFMVAPVFFVWFDVFIRFVLT
jgi:hypothetical protein